MRMAPLLLIAVGLIVVFRAGIWNLGIDGQFLLAAAIVAVSRRSSNRICPTRSTSCFCF